MLYKNDEIFRLTPQEIGAIEKYFHDKFPVKVVYPPGRIVKSRLPHNRLPDKPNSISFDLRSTVRTPTGTEVWRYAEEVIIDNAGNKKYTPKKFRFSGSHYLSRNNIELIYFLLKKSEYRWIDEGEMKENPKLTQAIRPKFAFEDLVTEAEKKAEKRALEARIGNLLYGDEGLSEDRLRLLANAYFIRNVDDLTLPQVRILIEQEIHKTKDGTNRFFEMIGDDAEVKVRNDIQRAINKGLIFYDMGKKTWFWNIPEGKKEYICKVPPTKSANNALYDVFLGDKSFQDDLTAALLTLNPKAGKKVEKINVDD